MVGTATEELLSLPEAADRLGVSIYTLRRWIKDGKLRAFKPGKEYRIQEADLEEFLRTREFRPKAPRRSPYEPSFNDVLEEERQTLTEQQLRLIESEVQDRLAQLGQGIQRPREEETEPTGGALTISRGRLASILRAVEQGELTAEEALQELGGARV